MIALQKLIYNNPQTWMQILASKSIVVKEDEHFYIFNYDIGADFSDEVVRNCRGIILDKDFNIVCYPFDKFCNYHETYHDDIDWSTARVQSKIDGSILKLWFNKYTQNWQWSTNSMINASETENNYGENFLELIKETVNYKDIQFNVLDKNKTYIFELIGPSNKVVIIYDTPMLYHIGTRDNITCLESNDDIGIIKPNEYDLHSLDDCLKAVSSLNKKNADSIVQYEGFVVVDKNWHRVKIKSPEYLLLHHMSNGITKKQIIQLILTDDINIEEVKIQYPYYAKLLTSYEEKVAKLIKEAQENMDIARELAKTIKDRKEIALEIKNNKYNWFMFRAIDDEYISAKQIVYSLQPSKLETTLDKLFGGE